MKLHDAYDEILEWWLQTKWSRVAASIKTALTISSIYLPNFLDSIGITLTPQKTLLIRSSMPPLLLFLGTFVVLLIVVRYFKSLVHKGIDQNIELSDLHEKVLSILFKNPISVRCLCEDLNITKEEANYYLNYLFNKSMVCFPQPYSSVPENWRIDQDGREYIIKNKKIT